MKAKQAGFTLVEIAIVLVIIGLLLGGVLKGQELITQARIKNIVNDFNGITAATYAYQDRYKALPGDDGAAAGRWGTTSSGNGNGVVETGTAPAEVDRFWQHLRLAGLITGDSTLTAAPINAFSGQTLVNPSAVAHNLTGLVMCTSNLPGKVSEAIDSQLDDGRPCSGSIRAAANDGTNLCGGTPPATRYVDDGATLYNVCKNL